MPEAIDVSKIVWEKPGQEPQPQGEVQAPAEPQQSPTPEQTDNHPAVAGQVAGQPEATQPVEPEWKSKFGSEADLWKAYQELSSKPPEVKEVVVEKEKDFEDERLKELVSYYQSGGDLSKYLEAKFVNYDNFAEEDLIRRDLEMEYPSLDRGDIDKLFQARMKSYGIGSEDDDETLVGKIRMKADAMKVRARLKTEQQKFQLPEVKQVATAQPAADAQAIKEAEEAFNKWKASLWENQSLKQYRNSKKVAVKYGDKELNYDIKNWEVAERITENDQDFFKLFATGNPENPVDWDKWVKVIAFATDPDGYDKALVSFGKSMGAESIVGEITNPSTKEPMPPQAKEESLFEAISKAIEAKKKY